MEAVALQLMAPDHGGLMSSEFDPGDLVAPGLQYCLARAFVCLRKLAPGFLIFYCRHEIVKESLVELLSLFWYRQQCGSGQPCRAQQLMRSVCMRPWMPVSARRAMQSRKVPSEMTLFWYRSI